MNKEICRKLRNNPTPQEIIMWSRIRRSQIGYKFRRQYCIGKYIVDFYCPKLKLAIEIDGWQHKKEFSGENEEIRTQYLKNKGITILRFWNNDINDNIDNVMLEIDRIIGSMK